jgi:hypothetical protein
MFRFLFLARELLLMTSFRAFATLRPCRTFILLRPYRNFTKVVLLTFVFHDFDIQTKTKIAFFTRRFCAFLIYVGYLLILLIFTRPSQRRFSPTLLCLFSLRHNLQVRTNIYDTIYTNF